jgi:hypothetical protein
MALASVCGYTRPSKGEIPFFPLTFFPPILLIFILYLSKGLDYEEAFEESANIENNCQLMLPPFSQVRAS